MSLKYSYLVYGGCGRTELNLNISENTNTFSLNYSCKWMGSDAKQININNGIIKKLSDQVWVLTVPLKQGDSPFKDGRDLYHLIRFPEPIQFPFPDDDFTFTDLSTFTSAGMLPHISEYNPIRAILIHVNCSRDYSMRQTKFYLE